MFLFNILLISVVLDFLYCVLFSPLIHSKPQKHTFEFLKALQGVISVILRIPALFLNYKEQQKTSGEGDFWKMHRISSPRWIITERFHNNTISRIFHPTPLSSRNNKKGNSPPLFFYFFYLTFQVAWKALFPRSPVPTEDHIVPASINRNQEKVSWRYKLFSFPLKRIHFLKNHLRPWSPKR